MRCIVFRGVEGSEVVAVEARPDPSPSTVGKALLELPESEDG
jgi:hypothetical protein